MKSILRLLFASPHLFTLRGVPVRMMWISVPWMMLLFSRMYSFGSIGFLFGFPLFFLVLYLSVLLHEMGHVLEARQHGIETSHIILNPLGGVARLKSLGDTAKEEFQIALAGPVVSAILAAIPLCILTMIDFLAPELWFQSDVYRLGAVIALLCSSLNLILTLFNLLPIYPLDGGRIFNAVLSVFASRTTSLKATAWIAGLGGTGMAAFGIYHLDSQLIFIGGLIIFYGPPNALARVAEINDPEFAARIREHYAQEEGEEDHLREISQDTHHLHPVPTQTE